MRNLLLQLCVHHFWRLHSNHQIHSLTKKIIFFEKNNYKLQKFKNLCFVSILASIVVISVIPWTFFFLSIESQDGGSKMPIESSLLDIIWCQYQQNCHHIVKQTQGYSINVNLFRIPPAVAVRMGNTPHSPGTNQIAWFAEFRTLTSWEKDKRTYLPHSKKEARTRGFSLYCHIYVKSKETISFHLFIMFFFFLLSCRWPAGKIKGNNLA